MTQIAALPTLSVQISTTTTPQDGPYSSWQWIDASAYVQGFNTRGGKQHELDRYETGNLVITLNNRTGIWTPWLTTSTTYPLVGGGTVVTTPTALAKPMTPIRIVANWSGHDYPIFFGFVESWTLSTPDEQNRMVTIVCSDIQKILSTTRLQNATLYEDTVNPNTGGDPTKSLIRCDEKVSANTLADSITNATITGGPSPFDIGVFGSIGYGSPGPLPYDNSTAVDLSNGSTNPRSGQGFLLWPDNLNVTNITGSFTIEAWVQSPRIGDVVLSNYRPNQFTAVGVSLDVNGHAQIIQRALNISGAPTDTTLYAPGAGPALNDGSWHLVSFLYLSSTANLHVYVDGVECGTGVAASAYKYRAGGVGVWYAGTQSASVPYAACAATVANVVLDWDPYGTNTADFIPRIQNRYRIGSLLLNDVPTGVRIIETLQIVGLVNNTFVPTISPTPPPPPWTDDGTNSGSPIEIAKGYEIAAGLTGDLTGKTASEIILTTTDTEIGAFYIQPDGTLTFRDKFYWTENYLGGSLATISNLTTAAESTYTRYTNDVELLQDDLDLWTAAQITTTTGGQVNPSVTDLSGLTSAQAQARFGLRTIIRSTYATTRLVANKIGQTLLWRHQVPKIRVSKVTLTAESGDPTTTSMMSLAYCDSVTYERTDDSDPFVARMSVEAIAHEFKADPGEWHTTYTLSPFETTGAPYFKLDSATYGRLDGGFTLRTALVSGTTYTTINVNALDVAINTGTPFTLTSGTHVQTFTTGTTASAGATTLNVASFTANYSYPIGAIGSAVTYPFGG